ncbi:MAG: CcmD family protein [Candidatus Zixiibacteriota bacterium]|nr:MAG: CcmD family protein [candidate division Zixibacteria bacterium]
MDGNYIALAVTLVVWVGLFYFIMSLDKSVKKLEEKIK